MLKILNFDLLSTAAAVGGIIVVSYDNAAVTIGGVVISVVMLLLTNWVEDISLTLFHIGSNINVLIKA